MDDDTKTLEDMTMPCPDDICDGSGILEDGKKCPCSMDDDRYDPDRDY